MLLVCPVLSVTLVYCGQTVGRIKMQLGTDVGLRPSHTVLDADPALSHLPKKGTAPNFRPMSVVANGWTDQDATWYRDRPRPRRHYIRWVPSSRTVLISLLPQKMGHSPPYFSTFQPMSIVAKRSPISATAELFV